MNIPGFLNRLLIDSFRWLAIGVAVIILALGYFFVVDAKLAALRTSGFLERNRVTSELEAQKKYLADLQSSVAQFDTRLSTAQREEINTFIPTGTDFPGLLLMLENLAAQANLKLASMNVAEVGQVASAAAGGSPTGAPTAAAASVAGLPVRIQDVSVSFQGGTSYEELKRFIELIESSRRLLDVVSLNFSHGEDPATGQRGASAYTMVVRTYYLPES